MIESTTASAQRVAKVHAGLREKMALFVAAPSQLSHAFRGCADAMVAAHADFQTHCTAVMVVLQKRAGGQVVGDRAVGTTSKEEGTLASDLAALQDLLVRPAQRIMKLGLFMDDMAADARQAQRAQEAEGLLESAEVVRGIVTEINGRSVEQVAARINGEGIHLLIDVDGYRDIDVVTGVADVALVLALRPTPLAVNWLGACASLGAAAVPFLISDKLSSPPEHLSLIHI